MYLQQEALLRPDLEGKEAAVCLPCYHIYRFLEQHYYKQGQEKLSEISHETSAQPGDTEGFPIGNAIGGVEEISPQFESSQTRGEPASNAAGRASLDAPELLRGQSLLSKARSVIKVIKEKDSRNKDKYSNKYLTMTEVPEELIAQGTFFDEKNDLITDKKHR